MEFLKPRRGFRHLIERHPATFRAAFPQRQAEVRHWIESPDGDLRGILFLPNSHQTNIRKPADRKSGSKPSQETRKKPVRPRIQG